MASSENCCKGEAKGDKILCNLEAPAPCINISIYRMAISLWAKLSKDTPCLSEWKPVPKDIECPDVLWQKFQLIFSCWLGQFGGLTCKEIICCAQPRCDYTYDLSGVTFPAQVTSFTVNGIDIVLTTGPAFATITELANYLSNGINGCFVVDVDLSTITVIQTTDILCDLVIFDGNPSSAIYSPTKSNCTGITINESCP